MDGLDDRVEFADEAVKADMIDIDFFLNSVVEVGDGVAGDGVVCDVILPLDSVATGFKDWACDEFGDST